MAFSVQAKLIYMAVSTVVIAAASTFPHRARLFGSFLEGEIPVKFFLSIE